MSRRLDLAERIPEIDARRNIVTGYSRLAKAALIAAARDKRFHRLHRRICCSQVARRSTITVSVTVSGALLS